MVNRKKVDNQNSQSAASSSVSKLRPTRKRRGALVETSADNIETDSDFVDEKDDVYKKIKQRSTEAENRPVTTQTDKKTATRKTKLSNKQASLKSKTGSDNEILKEQQKNATASVRNPNLFSRSINNNFLSIMSGHHSGLVDRDKYYKSAVRPIMENVTKFRVSQLVTPFDRRVTALAWHPRFPHLAAAGSKGGDIILWDSERADSSDRTSEGRRTLFKSMIEGRGPGGSIQSLKFDINHPDKVYTASIDGTVTRHDFQGKDNKIYLETNDWERWYVGMDISFSGKMMVAGNNKGTVSLLTLEGERIWDLKLHKAKCNFVQFSEREPWMMVTTSTGGGATAGCKVWDIRNIKGPQSAITELPHSKAVNSAYFSKVTGDKLLTTDQHSELRVYQAPHFNLLRSIPHPHRQFQHLTPIKACWHPLADVVFAGRYPDPKFPDHHPGEIRSIDFFCPESGTSLHQLHQPGLSQIISLSQFSPAGDRLLSGMGQTVMIWQPRLGGDEEAGEGEAEEEMETNIEGLKVKQWPDFTAKKKQQRKKKETKGKDT